MSSPSTPASPPANPDPIGTFLREIAALPVSHNPLAEWMDAHVEELRPYVGQQAAIDPSRGLLAVSPTLEGLLELLKEKGLLQDTELTITPVF